MSIFNETEKPISGDYELKIPMPPRMDLVQKIFADSIELGRIEGVPPAIVVGQILLAAAGIAGLQLQWLREGESAPNYGRPSVTFLGSDDYLPFWFRRPTHLLIGWQEHTRRMFKDPKFQSLSPRLSRLREMRSRVRKWLPELGDALDATLGEDPITSLDLLIEINHKVPRSFLRPHEFGRDRLVILNGPPAYRAFERKTGQAPLLKHASLNEGTGLRTTLHGWVPAEVFRKLARSQGPEEARCFGWLLPCARLPMGDDPGGFDSPLMLGAFTELIGLRYQRGQVPMKPHPEMAWILDQADMKWEPPEWCNVEPLREMTRAGEQLAWQLTSVMTLMSRSVGVDRTAEEFRVICTTMASLARWIRIAHCQEVRLLFPGPPFDLAEPLSCKIADKLRSGKQSTRDLVRCIHKVATIDVRRALRRMQSEGWVVGLKNEEMWRLNFPPLPEVSANLSKIAEWPAFKKIET